MGLRAQAAADTRAIIENADDFGWPITVEDPNGFKATITGFAAEIGQLIDPGTGGAIAGRAAHVTLTLASLTEAGFSGYPVQKRHKSERPWIIRFNTIAGKPRAYAVADSRPDHTVGVVVCMLEDLEG